ncbi:MAG: PQQ-dependent sugar dehydrogenase [Ignavibacteriae bacterium]|nr:PQQ-dependent sugar dehydrogenase [Ignavibacteriota bacterium]MCB9244190.1 PQQ-dependent sugar dehydrogenase [Ignavibacteriales bacterium]
MKKLFSLLLGLMIWGISSNGHSQTISVQTAFPNVGSFTRPVFLTHAPDATDRIFVIEQRGVVNVWPNDSTTSARTTFMDIDPRVDNSGNEMGLLGLAFHPNYQSNGYFYVDYTTTIGTGVRRTRISRFQVSANPDVADTSTEQILMEIYQPYTNHNGGMLFFGQDGYLYICMGDGGSGGDPGNRAQTTDTLLGKILRINVDTTVGPQNYGIPSTNPFVGGGGAPEVFTWGMRNPWRTSQDPVTGFIYAADVGQESWEEIDIIENGKNYGWRCYEGNNPYNTSGCGPSSNYTFPIKEYPSAGSGVTECSVTGGYVYRGSRRPELVGRYIYGDYCSRKIWKLLYNGTVSEDQFLVTAPSSINSFGVDKHGELYICAGSTIYRFNLNTTVGIQNPNGTPFNFSLAQNYPNPFNPSTVIKYSIPELTGVKLTIYNTLGKEVKSLVNTTQAAGNYERQWNGTDNNGATVASGVYFYTLQTEGFTETKKMLLIK